MANQYTIPYPKELKWRYVYFRPNNLKLNPGYFTAKGDGLADFPENTIFWQRASFWDKTIIAKTKDQVKDFWSVTIEYPQDYQERYCEPLATIHGYWVNSLHQLVWDKFPCLKWNKHGRPYTDKRLSELRSEIHTKLTGTYWHLKWWDLGVSEYVDLLNKLVITATKVKNKKDLPAFHKEIDELTKGLIRDDF